MRVVQATAVHAGGTPPHRARKRNITVQGERPAVAVEHRSATNRLVSEPSNQLLTPVVYSRYSNS